MEKFVMNQAKGFGLRIEVYTFGVDEFTNEGLPFYITYSVEL